MSHTNVYRMPPPPKKENRMKLFALLVLGALIGEFIAIGLALWLI